MKIRYAVDVRYRYQQGEDDEAKQAVLKLLRRSKLSFSRLLEEGRGFCFIDKKRDIGYRVLATSKAFPRNLEKWQWVGNYEVRIGIYEGRD